MPAVLVHRKWEELEARREAAPSFPCPRREFDKTTLTLGTQPVLLSEVLWGGGGPASYNPPRSWKDMEMGRALQILCGNWGEPKGNREQLGPGPFCFRAEGAQGEGIGSELKLDSPMKLMGGQILP